VALVLLQLLLLLQLSVIAAHADRLLCGIILDWCWTLFRWLACAVAIYCCKLFHFHFQLAG
jgi:hypothetical protein